MGLAFYSRLAIVSIASLYLPTASVTTSEVKEASSDPGFQHGVVGFQEAGVDCMVFKKWSRSDHATDGSHSSLFSRSAENRNGKAAT